MFLVVDGATFAFAISLLSETTIIPAFVSALTGSSVLVGLVAATFAIGRYLPQLVGSHLVLGRSRRKPLFLAIVIAERIGILAIALSASLIDLIPTGWVTALFFLSFCFYAITTGLIGPVYGDFVAKALTQARGVFFGTVQLIGGVLGFTAALWAEGVLKEQGFPEGNQFIFWVSFGLSFLSILFVAGLREDEYPHTEPRPRFLETVKSIPGIVFRDKNYGRFLLARAFLASATLGFGFVVVDGLEGSLVPSDAAALAAVFILSQAVVGFGLGVLGNYRGWRLVFVLGAFLILGGMLGAIFASSLLSYIIVFILLGGANAVTVIGDPNMSIEMAPTSRTSLYLGATSTLLAPFFIVGPLVGGFLVPVFGYSVVFGISATLGVIGLVLAFQVNEPRTVIEEQPVGAFDKPGAQT
ncbi:MAG: MFS transporter [Pontimonas sp.]|nr:MFS transporter [Pontimonas sp.]